MRYEQMLDYRGIPARIDQILEEIELLMTKATKCTSSLSEEGYVRTNTLSDRTGNNAPSIAQLSDKVDRLRLRMYEVDVYIDEMQDSLLATIFQYCFKDGLQLKQIEDKLRKTLGNNTPSAKVIDNRIRNHFKQK